MIPYTYTSHNASGSGYTTTPDLHWQEADDSDRVGGFTAYFRGMHKGYGLRGRREAPGDVMASGGIWKTSEGRVRRDFGGSKGAAAGLCQSEQGQGGGGSDSEIDAWGRGGCYRYAGIETGDARVGGWSHVVTGRM